MRSRSEDTCLADMYFPWLVCLVHILTMEGTCQPGMCHLTLTSVSWSTDLLNLCFHDWVNFSIAKSVEQKSNNCVLPSVTFVTCEIINQGIAFLHQLGFESWLLCYKAFNLNEAITVNGKIALQIKRQDCSVLDRFHCINMESSKYFWGF
jgi:hypothetical protein